MTTPNTHHSSLQDLFKFLDPNCIHFICDDAMVIQDIMHNNHLSKSEYKDTVGGKITDVNFTTLSKKTNPKLDLNRVNGYNVYSTKHPYHREVRSSSETETLIGAMHKLPVAIVFVDSTQNIISSNKKFSSLIGIKNNQVIDRNFIDLITLASTNGFSPLDTGKFLFEFKNQKSSVNYVVEVEFHPHKATLHNKSIDGYYILHDTTEHRNIKKSLQEVNEKFHYTSKFVNEALFNLNIENKEMIWGEGVNKLFGYEMNFCPSWEVWTSLIHPDDYKASRNGFFSTLRQKNKNTWNHTFRMLKSNGKYAHIASSAYIIRSEDDKPIRVIGTLRDISEQINIRKDRARLINSALKNERKKISMELHDSIGQYLIAVNLYLNEIECNKEEDTNFQKCHGLVQDTIKITHDLCYQINPPKLSEGIINGIQLLADEINQTSSISIEFIHEQIKEEQFDLIDTFQNFRIIQEFINNSVKHSKASNLDINMYEENQSIFVEIKDNGVGFDLNNEAKFRLGVKNMVHRAELANTFICLDSGINGTYMKLKLNDIILV